MSGSNHFDQYETEGVAKKPTTIVEELEACKEQLELARERLKLANELIKGIWIQDTTIFFIYFVVDVVRLRAENKMLRRRRGLECACNGNCRAHDQGLYHTPI